MIDLSNRVKANFNNASKSYDVESKVQQQAASFLVSKLLEIKNFNPRTILDLGTGTGYVPELLVSFYPQSSYMLNDIAEQMLELCKLKFASYPDFTFLHGNMETLSLKPCDLIISNLALQWVESLPKTLEFFYTKSSEVFAFSTLLDGTFQEWQDIVNQYQNIKLQNYPTATELVGYCNNIKGNHAFDYWTMDIPISFDSPLVFMHHLKALGASASNDQMPQAKLKALLREQNKPLTVSYKIFFGIFKKVE